MEVIVDGVAYVPKKELSKSCSGYIPGLGEYFTVKRSHPTIDRSYLDDVFVCVAKDANTVCAQRYHNMKCNLSCVVFPMDTWDFFPTGSDVAKAVFKELYVPKKGCPHSYLHRFGCKCNCS